MSNEHKLVTLMCLVSLAGLFIAGCAAPGVKATEVGYADLIDKIEFEKINIFPSPDRLAALHYNLAELYFANAKYEEARKEAKDAISLSPNKWEYHLQLAKTYIALGKFDDAELEVKALPSDLLNPLSLIAMPFMLLSQPEKEAFVKDAKKWGEYPLKLTLSFDTETLQADAAGVEIKGVIQLKNGGDEMILLDTRQLEFRMSDQDGKVPYNLSSVSGDDYTVAAETDNVQSAPGRGGGDEEGRFIVLAPMSIKSLMVHRSIARWKDKETTAPPAGEYVAFARYSNLGNLTAPEQAISSRSPHTGAAPRQLGPRKENKSDILRKHPDAKPWVGILTSQPKVVHVLTSRNR